MTGHMTSTDVTGTPSLLSLGHFRARHSFGECAQSFQALASFVQRVAYKAQAVTPGALAERTVPAHLPWEKCSHPLGS